MSILAIINLLDTVLMLATEIPALFAKATALKNELTTKFVDTGRTPTPAEWDAVNAQTAALLGTLQLRSDDAEAHLQEVADREE
jgi:hypothetical protein